MLGDSPQCHASLFVTMANLVNYSDSDTEAPSDEEAGSLSSVLVSRDCSPPPVKRPRIQEPLLLPSAILAMFGNEGTYLHSPNHTP